MFICIHIFFLVALLTMLTMPFVVGDNAYFFGARINIMSLAVRFTGNASRTIFPPITRVAQGVMGGRRAVEHTPVGVGHPKAAMTVAKERTRGCV